MDSPFEVDGVPQNDCGSDQIQATCTVALRLKAAIADFAKPVEEDRTCKCIAGLALVQADVNAAAQFDVLQLVEDEQCTLDTTDLA